MLSSESVIKGSITSHFTLSLFFDLVACILYVGLVLLIDFSRPGMMALLLLEIPHAINWMLFLGSELKLCENIGRTSIISCQMLTLLIIQLGCDVVAIIFRMQYLILCDTLAGTVSSAAMDSHFTFGVDYTCKGGHWWLELLIVIFQLIVVLSSIIFVVIMCTLPRNRQLFKK